MATFDQLPAEQRAIIELVVQRGRTYDDLADMLGMEPSRVRELAREALSDLSPVTAGRVDDDWRGQLADYVLGQQSGPESKATQGHLRRSEEARTWALSVLDSLDTLYEDGRRPDIPAAENGGRESTKVRERPGEPRRREREREAVRDRERARPLREGGPLSAAARSAVLRRRAIAGAVALAATALLVWLIFLRGDDDDGGDRAAEPAQQAQNAAGQPEIIGQIELRPQGDAQASGFAFIGRTGQDPVLIVQGKVPTVGENEAYEVWLYNDRNDAVSLGAQQPDENGDFSGAGPLPGDFDKYEFIDVSRERVDRADDEHSGVSVLRGELASLAPVGGAQGGAAPEGGGQAPEGGQGTTPAP